MFGRGGTSWLSRFFVVAGLFWRRQRLSRCSERRRSAGRRSPPFVQDSDTVSVSGSIQVIDSGTTATGGWVEFTGEGTVTVDMKEAPTGGASAQGLTTKKVGGGTWTYGTGVSVVGEKTCTSKYFHASRDHSSTVRMGPRVKRSTTWSGNWSYAKVQGWTTATCKEYWNNL